MYKITDIAKEISTGLTPLRSNPKYWDKGTIPWLKTEQIGQFCIKDTSEHITKYALEDTGLKLYPINTVSVAMYGEGKTRGRVSILNAPMTTNQACCNIVVDGNLADPFYVYYFLKTQYYNLRRLSSGVRKNLNSDDIKNYSINLPNKTTQKKIVKILYCLDEKIELNNRINSKLEQLSKDLYNYWFMQFDFPDEFGRPYKSSGGKMVYNEVLKREMPASWGVKHVKDFVDVITGKEDANFSDPNGQYNFFTCGDEVLKCNKFAFCGKSILIAGNGNFNIKYFDGKFNAYQRTYVLQPKDIQYIGIIYLSAVNRIQAFTRGSNGSIVKFITKSDVEGIPLLLPDNKKLLNILNSLLDQQNHIRNENEMLIDLRDFLLPMLMNGQVTINP